MGGVIFYIPFTIVVVLQSFARNVQSHNQALGSWIEASVKFLLLVLFILLILCYVFQIVPISLLNLCFLNLPCICFSYVFDGKPPDLKKQELAKRYFFSLSWCFLTKPNIFEWQSFYILIILPLFWCSYSKRADATDDLNKAIEVLSSGNFLCRFPYQQLILFSSFPSIYLSFHLLTFTFLS